MSSFTRAAARGWPLLLLVLSGCTSCDPPRESPPDSPPDGDTDTDTDADTEQDLAMVELLDPYAEPAVRIEPHDARPGDTVTLVYEGELAEVDSLNATVGYNGLLLDFMGEGPPPEDTGGEPGPSPQPEYTADYAMQARDGGGFEIEIELPEEAEAIHAHFKGMLDAVLLTDDNEGLFYNHGLEFPYAGPWLTWNDHTEPSSGVVVSWHTAVPCLGVVAYWAEGDQEHGYAVGTESDSLHHVVLRDLVPDTVYEYRVFESTGRASPTHQFRTAQDDPESFDFVFMSDIQDDGVEASWESISAELAANHGDARFAVVPGDLAHLNTPPMWWLFFDHGRDLLAKLVIMPVPGNHDSGTRASHDADTSGFERWFSLPNEDVGAHYAFDYGNAHFLMLNSEVTEAFLPPAGEQYVFAQEDLAMQWDGAQRVSDHVFAAWHVPPYNVGSRHSEQQLEYRPVTELLEGVVDWVLCGHEHFAQRFVPTRFEGIAASSGQYGIGPEDGVGYWILPPAGNEKSTHIQSPEINPEAALLHELLAWPTWEMGEDAPSEQGFMIVQVRGEQLTLQVWGMGTYLEPSEAWIREELSNGD